MRMLAVSVLLLQALLWSASLHAAGWYSDVRVKYLYAGTAGGRYAIKLVSLSPNPDSCPDSSDLEIEETHPKFRQIWAMLMTAYLADKPVNIYLSGCTSSRNLPKVTDVMLGTDS